MSPAGRVARALARAWLVPDTADALDRELNQVTAGDRV